MHSSGRVKTVLITILLVVFLTGIPAEGDELQGSFEGQLIAGVVNIGEEVEDETALLTMIRMQTEAGLGFRGALGSAGDEPFNLVEIHHEENIAGERFFLSAGYQWFEASEIVFRGLKLGLRADQQLTNRIGIHTSLSLVPFMKAEIDNRSHDATGLEIEIAPFFRMGETLQLQLGIRSMRYTAAGSNSGADLTGILFGSRFIF